jgi:hypothetical protein
MKIAYLILAHRYPLHLVRLVSRLDTADANFFVHLDRRSPRHVYETLVRKLGSRQNVHFVKRYPCRWGSFGIVRASLQGLADVLESEVSFDYLALLSGQDYPIKSNAFICSFLRQREGTSFIHHNPFPFTEWVGQNGGWDRVRMWHLRTDNHYLIYPEKRGFRSRVLEVVWNAAVERFPLERRFPGGFHPYGGAQFWCLHRDHVRQLHEFTRANPRFVRFFRFVNIPDEIFFQTIAANILDGIELHNDTLTYVPWNRPGATLHSSDFEALLSTHHLFARKFDPEVDARVLEMIDRELLPPAREQPTGSGRSMDR